MHSPRHTLALPTDAGEPDPAYRAALEWIWSFSSRPMGTDPSAPRRMRKLDRMRALLERLGDPQRAYPSILVAGTKGKGSTVAFLAAAFRAGGRRVGRYTSPHLLNWRERTWVDGAFIEPSEVLELVVPVREAVERLPGDLGLPTTFEVGTAITLLYFARRGVDLAVVEAGVGGVTDATNVLDPVVSAITAISFDHTEVLGHTLDRIARHKAGIARPGRPLVSAPQEPEALAALEEEAGQAGARLVLVGRDWAWAPAAGEARDGARAVAIGPVGAAPWLTAAIPLPGDHQRENATVAVAALAELAHVRPDLAIDARSTREGLETTAWPGRLQVVGRSPLVVLDGAHNGASARAVAASLRRYFAFDSLHLVLGLSAEKDAAAIIRELAPAAATIRLTRSHHERARSPADLVPLAIEAAPAASVCVVPEPLAALDGAVHHSGPLDLVLVTGSLFLVGEALDWARDRGKLGYAPARGE